VAPACPDPEKAFAAAMALQRAGRLAEAERAWRALGGQLPNHAGVHANLAMVLWQLGRHDDAEAAAADALARDPGMVQAQAISAAAAEARGAEDLAIERYRLALELKPDLATALHGLAKFYLRKGDLAAARAAAERMTEVAPLSAVAWDALGAIRLAEEDVTSAEQALAEALRLEPKFASARANLAAVAAERRDWTRVLDHADAALVLDAGLAEAHNNRANALAALGREDEAGEALERALALDPDNPDVLFNRALMWLRQGRWTEAWPGFEARWRVRRMAPWRRDFQIPEWDGRPAPGKTLLVHAEQGLGDTIMVARYLPPVAARVGALVVECAPVLVRLIEAMPGMPANVRCVAAGQPLPPFELHMPTMSLPGRFAATPDSVPWPGAYMVSPSPPAVFTAGELNVGLCWAGNPRNSADPDRSAPLARLAPLLDVPGVRFHSLQFGPAGDQIADVGIDGRIADHRARMTDFAATSALVAGMDLVISVCTSVAHLAGAMGRPLWVLLSADADWRWLDARDISPWYPTARLFRQRAAGDWDELAKRVAGALAEQPAKGRPEGRQT
jgi:tetratricopeptide (TPR) repeat protein